MLSFFIFLLCHLALSKPVSRRAIDLDNNGIPDFCFDNGDGTSNCWEDGSWTRVENAQTSTSLTWSTKPTTISHVTLVTTTTSTAVKPTISTTTRSSTSHSNIDTTSKHTTLPSSAITSQPAIPSPKQLPSPDQFKQDKGTKWNVEYVGDIQYTGVLATENLYGDKCRSSKLGNKTIWNCGDMMCGSDYRICGFSMGPAFYGTDSVMVIDTDDVQYVNNNDFVQPWKGDTPPQAPHNAWGMDTSNVAAINDTHGVAYAWAIWRGASDGSIVNQGNAVSSVTLGESRPIAQRVSPLLTGPDSVGLGMLAILRDGDYIYTYSSGGPSKLIVSRVAANDDVFDSTKYESLEYSSALWSKGIPKSSDTVYGMVTSNPGGQFGCAVYGSVFFNNYLNKYTIICSIFMSYVNMYTSDTPYGPWSSEYNLLSGQYGYGSMAHPEYSPGGYHKELYFSQGPNTKFNMFKVTFEY